MADVFISYARSRAADAAAISELLRAAGYDVWRDNQLPAHRTYGEVIEETLASAKAVLVLWSAEAAASQWVRSEADRARLSGKLVQLSLDGARLPMPFDQIQCPNLSGWRGEATTAEWRTVAASLAEIVGRPSGRARPHPQATPQGQRPAICVLPFSNMSGDLDQEYFSDGISEDIITDLSKVSALSVTARNTAFTFKGRSVDVPEIARRLGVSHVLEGSVRKAGGRVRITAQLIDGQAGDHLWAERWDRDLTDIFAVQDEISQAIVAALKLKLLPEEKKALGARGTESARAYDLFLEARQLFASGNLGDPRCEERILALARQALAIDPDYARAWALIARVQASLRFRYGRPGEDGSQAAEKALAIEPALAEPHAVKARALAEQGRAQEAMAEIETALRLDPDSYEVNISAGYIAFRQRRFETAIGHYLAASRLMEGDYHSPGTLLSCYEAIGDGRGAKESARLSLARAEAAVAEDATNGSAMGFAVVALTTLGESERARDWIARALAADPANLNMRYNLACAMCGRLGDSEAAIDLLEPVLAAATETWLNHIKIDPDLDALRGEARFQGQITAAETRLATQA
ncbi:MAG: TIR domain-containing protein [Caulobacteraceae bacterium]